MASEALNHLVLETAKRFKELNDGWPSLEIGSNFQQILEKAIERTGVGRSDIDYERVLGMFITWGYSRENPNTTEEKYPE